MTRLILHIGPPKSGTSALQSWLMENAAALEPAGLAVPTALMERNPSAPELARALMGMESKAPRAKVGDQLAMLRDWVQVQTAPNVIVSAEFLFNLVPWQVPVTQPAPWAVFVSENGRKMPLHVSDPDALQRQQRHLVETIQSLGFDQVDVIFTIREITSWHASRHMQWLKTGNGVLSLPFLEPGDVPLPDMAALCQLLSNAGFRVLPIAYDDPSGRDIPLLSRIFEALGGLPNIADFGQTPGRHNVSPGAATAIALAHLLAALNDGRMEAGPAFPERSARRVVRFGREREIAGDVPFQPFASEAADKIRARQAVNIEALSPWMPEPNRHAATAKPAKSAAQGPMTVAELDDDMAGQVLAWFDAVADEIAAQKEALPNIVAEKLRSITRHDARPHAMSPSQLAEFGGGGA